MGRYQVHHLKVGHANVIPVGRVEALFPIQKIHTYASQKYRTTRREIRVDSGKILLGSSSSTREFPYIYTLTGQGRVAGSARTQIKDHFPKIWAGTYN